MWGWTMGKDETLATIWEIPDHLWEQIHPVILDMDPPQSTGRKRADPRRMLDGIIFRMRRGCQWNRLPRELGGVDWEWQSADCSMGKARLGGRHSNKGMYFGAMLMTFISDGGSVYDFHT